MKNAAEKHIEKPKQLTLEFQTCGRHFNNCFV